MFPIRQQRVFFLPAPVLTGALFLLVSSCASLMQPPSEKIPVETELMLKQGKFVQAYEAYQRIARTEAGSPAGEEAAYRAARVLVSSRNPARSYPLAAEQFEAYLQRYPSGRFAEDAAAWLAALTVIRESSGETLRAQIDDLMKQLASSETALLRTESERDSTTRERDALQRERDEFGKKLEDELREKDELLRTTTALLQERDGLAKDTSALKQRVAALTKEREKLLAAKAKLEQRLRDVTEVDVTMEKERQKVK